MKKIITKLAAAITTLSLCLGLAACSASETKASDSSKGGDFKVGAIYINSQNDTSGYTYAHHKGITTAMEEMNLSVSDDLFIVDNVPEDDEKVKAAIDTLAGKGCNIIFGISFGYINAMDEAAKEYPDIIFSHATGYLSNDTNFNNYFGRIYQARYLAGIAAGYKSLELQNNNIGYVSAWGTEYAETCSGINAFTLGVRAVNPDAVTHVYELQTWGDNEKERQAAQILIDTYDCCVIAQHCDSAQPQLVAAEKGVFGCGYNSDMAVDAPAAHLTAPVWNWNVYYKLAMETAKNDPSNFMNAVGNYYGGLKEGFVDISPLTDNVPAAAADAIKSARELMISGEWDVFSGTALKFDAEGNVQTVDAALKSNDGSTIVEAGGVSVEDAVITGSMDYFVEGVIQDA